MRACCNADIGVSATSATLESSSSASRHAYIYLRTTKTLTGLGVNELTGVILYGINNTPSMSMGSLDSYERDLKKM